MSGLNWPNLEHSLYFYKKSILQYKLVLLLVSYTELKQKHHRKVSCLWGPGRLIVALHLPLLSLLSSNLSLLFISFHLGTLAAAH